ncbi:hypothetical protein [Sulfuricurvum sp.]|uniref:hypothetical protein n=1 Tax=Sulfuricurvum sp. TaxID=2025608 RepID=UPI002E37F506|nr:hypothetical protein [Sulfuricurvum sp.]HEX5330466.1 hypothetical protein [Sulfuricurvum sp.]
MKIFILIFIASFNFFINELYAQQIDGKYVLANTGETKSELWLHSNGTYEWNLELSTQERFESFGVWSVLDGVVTLSAQKPSIKTPSYFIDKATWILPWNFGVEKSIQDQLYESAVEKSIALCPFSDMTEYAFAAPEIAEKKLSLPVLKKRANTALQKLIKYKRIFEIKAKNAIRIGTRAAYDEALVANEHFQVAWNEVKQSHWDAHLAIPNKPEVVFPLECHVPKKVQIDENNPKLWSKKGVGFEFYDPKKKSHVNGILAEVLFSDGSKKRVSSRIAATMIEDNQQVIGVLLSSKGIYEDEPYYLEVNGVIAGNIYQINVDSDQVVPPIFETFVLSIKEDGLESVLLGGMYRK